MPTARICLWMLLLSAAISDAVAQDWSISVTDQPPANAHVGDLVDVTAQISVDAGADDLSVSKVYAGAGTSGVSGVSFLTQPTNVSAGTSANVTSNMFVVSVPGSAGVHLQVAVDGVYGAAAGTRTASTNPISVLEGVTATLSGGAPQVHRDDQIAFDLALVSSSETDAQISVPDAGYAAPVGTTLVMRTHGGGALTAGSVTHFGLVVAVSNSNNDGAAIAMTPTDVMYAMSEIGLSSRAVAITPATVASVVVVPIFVDGFELP